MRNGSTVRVSGDAGQVIGEVVDVRTPDQLADVPGFNTGEVRHILREFGVIEFALIAYDYGDQRVVFAALHTSAGVWRDLQRQELTIEELRPHCLTTIHKEKEQPTCRPRSRA